MAWQHHSEDHSGAATGTYALGSCLDSKSTLTNMPWTIEEALPVQERDAAVWPVFTLVKHAYSVIWSRTAAKISRWYTWHWLIDMLPTVDMRQDSNRTAKSAGNAAAVTQR